MDRAREYRDQQNPRKRVAFPQEDHFQGTLRGPLDTRCEIPAQVEKCIKPRIIYRARETCNAVVYIAERANGAYPSAVDAWIHPEGCFGRLGTLDAG